MAFVSIDYMSLTHFFRQSIGTDKLLDWNHCSLHRSLAAPPNLENENNLTKHQQTKRLHYLQKNNGI